MVEWKLEEVQEFDWFAFSKSIDFYREHKKFLTKSPKPQVLTSRRMN